MKRGWISKHVYIYVFLTQNLYVNVIYYLYLVIRLATIFDWYTVYCIPRHT